MPLRPLAEDDLSMIREWRNHPSVRANMFSSGLISETEHRAWFARLQIDPHAHWYVHENRAGIADGVVYFTGHDPAQRQAHWGFYLGSGAAPGSGALLGLEGLDLAFSELELQKLNAEVLAHNERSIRFHQSLGFRLEGIVRDGHMSGSQVVDVIRYGLAESQWRSWRDRVLRRVEAVAAGRQ